MKRYPLEQCVFINEQYFKNNEKFGGRTSEISYKIWSE